MELTVLTEIDHVLQKNKKNKSPPYSSLYFTAWLIVGANQYLWSMQGDLRQNHCQQDGC